MSAYRKKVYKKKLFDPTHEKGTEERIKEEVNLFRMEKEIAEEEEFSKKRGNNLKGF